jgi:type IV pilus assembly protein PilY1
MNKRNSLKSILSVYNALKAIGKQWAALFCGGLILLLFCADIYADPSQTPLSLTTSGQPNLLVILDNSNSMDEDIRGGAAGSNCPTSKSEIARSVIKKMITSYTDSINMGLMTYKQLSNPSSWYIHNSEYDVSYDPANYPPPTTPLTIYPRYSLLKTYSIPNPTSLGNYIYYNYQSPYYSSQNQGYGFCYSETADATPISSYPNGFNRGENGTNAHPWNEYSCYKNKTGTSDAPSITTEYSVYINKYKFTPSDSDNAVGITNFGKQMAWSFVGSAYFSSTSPGLGFLQTPIKSLTTAQGNTIQSLLACNVPQQSPYTPAVCTQNAACTTAGIKNAGNTPIQGTLQTANKYFAGTLSNSAQGYTASSYPLPLSCGKNYVILVTDGLPDTDSTGKIVVDPNGVAPGTTATAAAATEAGALLSSGVKTYVVGFGSAAQSAQLDAIATAGGTGVSYSASDYPTLVSALDSILQSILSSSNSAASVAANSTQLNTGSLIYQVKYNATDWSGQLLAYSVNSSTGAIITPALWEASSLLSSNSRSIYSFNPSTAAGSGGMGFIWGNLTTTQQTYLNTLSGSNDSKGSDRVAWLSGDQSKEQAQGGIFRNRTNLLGDIVDSAPVYVSDTDYGYGSLAGTEGSSYSTFLNSSAYINRTAMLYAGANDGMLHGFNASSTGGQEVFAYIPNALYPKLSQLTSPNYVHQFYVNGMSGVGDFYDTSTFSWHTLLAGATGAGGKALFALDVTDPGSFSASKVLWEFSNTAQPAPAACSTWGSNTNYDVNDLGYTLGQPLVVRLQDGTWVVLAANGYNSNNGHAVLFIIDAKSGCLIQKIDTVSADKSGLATVNGMSSLLAIDTNPNIDLSVDTVYAGDLHGNFWKFDLSGSAGSYPTPTTPFFVACTTSGSCAAANRQAITAKPNVGPAGGVGTDQNDVGWMVYFGTGQYFAPGDNVVGANPQVQSFYGLWDQGTSISDRALLQAQTITYQEVGSLACTLTNTCPTGTPTTTTNSITVVSKNPVCYATSSVGCTVTSPLKKGWALDLKYITAQGERVVSAPLVTNGLVVFATLMPSANQCTPWWSNLFEVGALSGGQPSFAPFDINGDGVANSQDQVLINGVAQYVSGINPDIGIFSTPTIIESTTVNYKYLSGSTGAIKTILDAPNSNMPNRSWRQLK